ncbi:luc7-like protein 3 [Macrosteles quadrilineatus]|uniref:luc7-like protein 3 n=1 Tax=Macrosteles quadrilineatus TaxID=74068 RepID=UPI0023E1D9CB|nr:luc7-like protein 3 [Macrosteles quadrilineatus]
MEEMGSSQVKSNSKSSLIEMVCNAVVNLNETNGSTPKQIMGYIESNSPDPHPTKAQVRAALMFALRNDQLVRTELGRYKIGENEEDKCRRKCTRMWTPKKLSKKRTRRSKSRSSLCKPRKSRIHRSRSSRCSRPRRVRKMSRKNRRCGKSRRHRRSRSGKRISRRMRRFGGRSKRRHSRRRRSAKRSCRKSSQRSQRRHRRRVKRCSTCTKMWTPKMMSKPKRRGGKRGKKYEEQGQPQPNEDTNTTATS